MEPGRSLPGQVGVMACVALERVAVSALVTGRQPAAPADRLIMIQPPLGRELAIHSTWRELAAHLAAVC